MTKTTIGKCADKLYKLRQERLKLQQVLESLKKEETELKNYLIDNISKFDSSGVMGKIASVRIITKDVPQVDDWDQLFKYVHKHKAFDLLQRRVSSEAVRQRWEEEQTIDGISTFTVVDVSITKNKES
jgi:hypothetical protein